MEDGILKTEIIKRWQAGVPVRVIVDPQAYPLHPAQRADRAASRTRASRSASARRHAWHPALEDDVFAGQNIVEFSGANYSPTAFVPQAPYSDYEDETIYFSDDPRRRSFMTEFDNLWVETPGLLELRQHHPTRRRASTRPSRRTPSLNFPQQESYALALLSAIRRRPSGST